MVQNPMNEVGMAGDGVGRLGDEEVSTVTAIKQKGRPRRLLSRNKGADDDDGGQETVEHFLDDAFEHYVSEERGPLSFESLTEWSEVCTALFMRQCCCAHWRLPSSCAPGSGLQAPGSGLLPTSLQLPSPRHLLAFGFWLSAMCSMS